MKRKLWIVEMIEDGEWVPTGIVYTAQAPAEQFAKDWATKRKTRVVCYVPLEEKTPSPQQTCNIYKK